MTEKKMLNCVVGDVHGCLDELDELIKTVGKGVRVILAGDLVDRGPDSVGVLRRAQELKLPCVLGNHDEKHIRYWKHEQKRKANPKYKNPIQFDEDQLSIQSKLMQEDVDFLKSLPLVLPLTKRTVVVHAGVEGDKPVEKQSEAVLRVRYVDGNGKMTGNDPYVRPPGAFNWYQKWKGPQNIIYGHWVQDLRVPHLHESAPGVFTLGLDTGACFGGHLTGVIIETNELVQIRAKAEYKKMKRPLPLFGSKSKVSLT